LLQYSISSPKNRAFITDTTFHNICDILYASLATIGSLYYLQNASFTTKTFSFNFAFKWVPICSQSITQVQLYY